MTPAQILCLFLMMSGELTPGQADYLYRQIQWFEVPDGIPPSMITDGVKWQISNAKAVNL